MEIDNNEREMLWGVRSYFVNERNKLITGWRWFFFRKLLNQHLAVIDYHIDLLDVIIDKPNRQRFDRILDDLERITNTLSERYPSNN